MGVTIAHSESYLSLMLTRRLLFLLVPLVLFSCSNEKGNTEETDDPVLRNSLGIDLEEIKERGVLKAMTTYSATSYFLYRGEPMGYEYEMLRRFADHLDVELDIVITTDIDSMFAHLNSGEVDIVAHGLAITRERMEEVAFSDYLYLVKQVLVQRKPSNWRQLTRTGIQSKIVNDPIELIGDTVSVRLNSSYFTRLQHLSDELGGEIIIDTLPGHWSTEEIIQMVVDEEVDFTIADNNLASINASYHPELDVSVPISFSQRIGWAVRPDAENLLTAMNEWISGMKKRNDYYVIYNKYFKNKRNYKRRVKSEFFSINNDRISEYDELVKLYAEEINWDWRLLSALIYQESKFRPEASSWADAQGLMQIMPATAADLGIEDRTDPEQSLRGGTQYLNQLSAEFENIPDSLERIKFTMAAFNAGLGHVFDARRLAEKRGLNPDVWDQNVAEAMLSLNLPKNYQDPVVYYGYVRGIEPYTYVSQIFERYGHYKRFIESSSIEKSS